MIWKQEVTKRRFQPKVHEVLLQSLDSKEGRFNEVSRPHREIGEKDLTRIVNPSGLAKARR